MTGTHEIKTKYERLLAQEEATKGELIAAEARLKTVDQEDVAAGAQAALEGKPLPARKAIQVKHKVENLGVDLKRLDEAIDLLRLEAIAAVGEGHADFPIFIPPGIPANRAEVVAEWIAAKVKPDDESQEDFERRIESQIPRRNEDAESIIAEAHRERENSMRRRLPRLTELRPPDLIAWVEAAFAAEDRVAADGYERRATNQRQKDAVEAVNAAKREHTRRGLPAGSFTLGLYPHIVRPEHEAEFHKTVGKSPFQQHREQLPPVAEAQNEPVAEPQPVVNEDEERRRREIAEAPPAPTVVAPPREPSNPDEDLPPQERAAARAARLQLAATDHLEVPPSQTPIVTEAS
jgi:hypothetical protein